MLFSDNIFDEILRWTNVRIEIEAAKYAKRSAAHNPVGRQELLSYLGILLFSGCQRDNHLSVREMWSAELGPPMYRSAMGQLRFEFLNRCLRFDDPATREMRRATDKFAPIRNVFDLFNVNCRRLYSPGEHLTVDEQLLGFRGKCPFRMYIPSKPAKYGVKMVMICDNKSKYMLTEVPYLGRDQSRPEGGMPLGHYYTKLLTESYHNSNRNVTTDNWFTSVSLVQDLYDNCGMTLVGTIRANKKEVPPEMKDTSSRELGSSAFLFTDTLTLVSYVPTTAKKRKIVLLLSSMHSSPSIGQNGKPEIVEFYNETKGGVDAFDQMSAIYSCGRTTNRWPMCIFYGMVNTAAINSWVIHSENISASGGAPINRRKFMQEVAKAFIKPWAAQRLLTPTLSISLKRVISDFCKVVRERSNKVVLAASRFTVAYCKKCPPKKKRKTLFHCVRCDAAVCLSHCYALCVDCIIIKHFFFS